MCGANAPDTTLMAGVGLFSRRRSDSTIEYGYTIDWIGYMMCIRTYVEMTRDLEREPTLVECALHCSLLKEEDVVRIGYSE